MRKSARSAWLSLVAACLWGVPAAATVTLDWVTVGAPGNACDDEPSFGCYGAVDYVYRIAKYEVTNAQYAEFLNAKATSDPLGLYNPDMAVAPGGITRSGSPGSYTYSAVPGRESKPVNRVSFFDALRFANWLHNGQADGDTETGAYTLLGGTPTPSNLLVQRNPEATIWLATDEEWYKAAHYETGAATYYEYQTGTDTEVVCTTPTATPNAANCDGFDGPGPGEFTDVGSYPGSPSPNGTFDQCGNALEWTDGDVGILENRIQRGGSYLTRPDRLGREIRDYDDPWVESARVGFRIASRAECTDGIDNDGDGLVDYPDDPGCFSAASPLEGPECDDGIDNDEDGFVDTADAACLSEAWRDLEGPVCHDGLDDDGDGRADFDPATFADPGDETTPPAGAGDPVCTGPTSSTEHSACQDGIDNDGDGKMDYDAGLSANGVADPNGPDPQCTTPWKRREGSGCGLGFELLLALPVLSSLYRRRRGASAALGPG